LVGWLVGVEKVRGGYFKLLLLLLLLLLMMTMIHGMVDYASLEDTGRVTFEGEGDNISPKVR
jgi:hypothetical protein